MNTDSINFDREDNVSQESKKDNKGKKIATNAAKYGGAAAAGVAAVLGTEAMLGGETELNDENLAEEIRGGLGAHGGAGVASTGQGATETTEETLVSEEVHEVEEFNVNDIQLEEIGEATVEEVAMVDGPTPITSETVHMSESDLALVNIDEPYDGHENFDVNDIMLDDDNYDLADNSDFAGDHDVIDDLLA